MSPSDYFYRSSIPHQTQVCAAKVSQLIACVQDSTDKTIQLQDNETYTCNVRSAITYSTGLSVTRHHPAGKVVEFLISTGLACVIDWHAGMLASNGGMRRLRAAEKHAKEHRLCLHANAPVPSSIAGKSDGATSRGHSQTFDATIVRLWSGDQVSVVEKDTGLLISTFIELIA